MKQFFYDRREPQAPKEGETEITWVTFRDSFNVDKVVRTVEYEKGKLVVVLDDGHEEARDIEARDEKGRPITRRERQWMLTQIYLNEEDTVKYWKMFDNSAMEFIYEPKTVAAP